MQQNSLKKIMYFFVLISIFPFFLSMQNTRGDSAAGKQKNRVEQPMVKLGLF